MNNVSYVHYILNYVFVNHYFATKLFEKKELTDTIASCQFFYIIQRKAGGVTAVSCIIRFLGDGFDKSKYIRAACVVPKS